MHISLFFDVAFKYKSDHSFVQRWKTNPTSNLDIKYLFCEITFIKRIRIFPENNIYISILMFPQNSLYDAFTPTLEFPQVW